MHPISWGFHLRSSNISSISVAGERLEVSVVLAVYFASSLAPSCTRLANVYCAT
jgi:hypothetical protein